MPQPFLRKRGACDCPSPLPSPSPALISDWLLCMHLGTWLGRGIHSPPLPPTHLPGLTPQAERPGGQRRGLPRGQELPGLLPRPRVREPAHPHPEPAEAAGREDGQGLLQGASTRVLCVPFCSACGIADPLPGIVLCTPCSCGTPCAFCWSWWYGQPYLWARHTSCRSMRRSGRCAAHSPGAPDAAHILTPRP